MPDPLSDLQRLGQEFDADVVTQADRDAAAETSKAIYYANSHSFACEADVEEMEGMLVQAFARHRIAAIEAARPMIEAEAWRPIESAPRDGTEIVMLDANVATATVGHWMVDPLWPLEIGALPHKPIWFPLATPTHWRPLPAPPSIEPQS